MLNNDILSQISLGFISLFSNFISALSGGGAGLIQLPALLFLGLPFSTALATHKVASVALGFGASIPHLKKNRLQIKFAFLILISGIPGVLLGAYTSSILPNDFSTSILGVLTLFLGFYSIKQKQLGSSTQEIEINKLRKIIGLLGLFIIGFLNGYLSSGTGLFVTIWMIKMYNLSFSVAVAYTLIFVGIFWNGIGALSLGLTGNIIWSYIPVLILGSLMGGYFGAYFSIIKGSKFIKFVFELVSFAVGISLLIKAFL
ncbi:sulfite exporter TauE/SafE family protein [Prochlorococcus marinus]|uniref:sulfite exporter TauE/SafE family protein n=1 Tax=Prochlorococcus marinus TaxID=1219 RepID=UPI0022B39896|nr:sulfite exporter TauE/SafE family protein [Prochlorococcus marinus]